MAMTSSKRFARSSCSCLSNFGFDPILCVCTVATHSYADIISHGWPAEYVLSVNVLSVLSRVIRHARVV